MITLFSARPGTTVFEYLCERNIEMEGLYCQNCKELAVASENSSETIISEMNFLNSVTNRAPSPDDKIFRFEYSFKRGDIIKGRFEFIQVFNIANAIIIEKKDGITNWENKTRLEIDS